MLQDTINKVAKSLRSIKQEVNSKHLDFKNDLELINLIFNIDIIIRTLEDIEEQIAFSKNNFLNKNILSPNEKEYIWKSLKEQQLNIKFEDEIYKFIEAIVSLQNNHIIIIVKIPTIEQQEYTLMQIEPVNANGNRIDTAIRYIAAHQQTFYEQKERCYICVNDNPVNDECVFNILVNQKARCRMHKQSDQPIVKELNAGTILINTDTAVHILDSCGDSRIVSSPTIVEAGNCTITVQNTTFKGNPKAIKQQEYFTPIFGKEIEVSKRNTNIEEVHQMNLQNLEEIRKLKLHIAGSHMLGAIALASLILLPLIIFCIRRYKIQHRNQFHQTDKKDIVSLSISSNPASDDSKEDQREKPFRFMETLFPRPESVFYGKPSNQPRTLETKGGDVMTEPATSIETHSADATNSNY